MSFFADICSDLPQMSRRRGCRIRGRAARTVLPRGDAAYELRDAGTRNADRRFQDLARSRRKSMATQRTCARNVTHDVTVLTDNDRK